MKDRRGPRGRRRRGRGSGRPQAAPAERGGVELTDARTFELLTEAGTPLDVDLEVAAFLYFANEGAARRAGLAVQEAGFTPYVDPSPPSRWVVEAARVFTPSAEAITEMGGRMRSIARANGGQYDGWWAVELPEEPGESEEGS